MSPLGVLVLGFRRSQSLWNVLESLRRQGALSFTHVWVDGVAHAGELREQVQAVRALAGEFPVAHWYNCNGRLGIEKLMLDGLRAMAGKYQHIIVLEDDCFPTADAVQVFREQLLDIEQDPSFFSVYGSHFGVEGGASRFARFQGWGWATTRDKLLPVLEQLNALFLMDEPTYLAWTSTRLTAVMIAQLDVTLERNVVNVLRRQFSWDSATTLVSASLGMGHRPTPRRVIYNCGAGEGSGHFKGDTNRYRAPPWNMIGVEEAWQYFHRPLAIEHQGREYFGEDDLDRALRPYLRDLACGLFVELPAFDGLLRSNTLALERCGWRGILVEPVADLATVCQLNRPLAQVVWAACGESSLRGTLALERCGWRGILVEPVADVATVCQLGRPLAQVVWAVCDESSLHGGEDARSLAERDALPCRPSGTTRDVGDTLDPSGSRYPPEQFSAPVKTLSEILDACKLPQVDFLSLRTAGNQQEVLNGIDWNRHAPRWILLEEAAAPGPFASVIRAGYTLAGVLNDSPAKRAWLFERPA